MEGTVEEKSLVVLSASSLVKQLFADEHLRGQSGTADKLEADAQYQLGPGGRPDQPQGSEEQSRQLTNASLCLGVKELVDVKRGAVGPRLALGHRPKLSAAR